MLNIKAFHRSLKSIWIKKYLDNENIGKWKLFLFLTFISEKHGGKRIFTGNLNTNDIQNLNIKDEFQFEILSIWAEINFQNSQCDFQNSPLWHNSLIRVSKTPVFFPLRSKKSVNYVKNLLDENFNILSYDAFIQKYDLFPNFLEYNSLILAVRSIKTKCTPGSAFPQEKEFRQLVNVNEFSKVIFGILIQSKTTTPWKSEKMEIVCGVAFLSTKDTKLRSFQFKLLHRRIATNDFLYKVGIASNNRCSFRNVYKPSGEISPNG